MMVPPRKHRTLLMAIALLAVVMGVIVSATTRPSQRTGELQFPGRNPSVLVLADRTLVSYVNEVNGVPRLFCRSTNGSPEVAVSPAGERVEARGEAGPTLISAGKLVAVVYSVSLSGAMHSTELRMQSSADGGLTWSKPLRINDDIGARSHAFADAAATRSGDVLVSWLDSRDGQQGVHTAVVGGKAVAVQPNATADVRTCQCCRTAVLTGSNGMVWLAYRDLGDNNVRNMVYAVSTDGGKSFQSRGPIADDGWSVNGCPESGPRLAESADGAVWAAWFNGAKPAIEVASSRNGKAFSPAVVIASPDATTSVVNHPEIASLHDGRMVVLYEATDRGGNHGVAMRASSPDRSSWNPPVRLAASGTNPSFGRYGSHSAAAWSHFAGERSLVTVLDPLKVAAAQ